jgi:hypothetical protein
MLYPKLERQHRLVRVWSNRELKKLSGLFTGTVINVSAADDQDKEGGVYSDYFLNKSAYFITNYAGDDGYQSRENEILLDMSLNLPDELKYRFDVVFNHTMLEHVFDIFTAFRNLCQLSKDIVIVVVPFSQVQHAVNRSYGDYWRFTPLALRKLFEENGLKVIYEAESPFQDSSVYLFFVGSRHPEKWEGFVPDFTPIKQSGKWIGTTTTTADGVHSTFNYSRLKKLIRNLFQRVHLSS